MEGAKSFYNAVSELVNLGYLDGSPQRSRPSKLLQGGAGKSYFDVE